MSVKETVSIQYQGIVNRAASQVKELSVPPEGWLCTVRKALKMSGAQLARRRGVSRALVSKTEKNELSGSVIIKTMQQTAEAMGCRFVCAIVPEHEVEDLITAHANEKASAIVKHANNHMALEGQALSSQQVAYEIRRLQKDMQGKLPRDFWGDDK